MLAEMEILLIANQLHMVVGLEVIERGKIKSVRQIEFAKYRKPSIKSSVDVFIVVSQSKI